MKNWSHCRLRESQAPMPYSIPKLDAQWQFYPKDKTLWSCKRKENWSHFRLRESQAPMPYSIPKIGVIWQSYFQIKTLFVIFILDDKTEFSPRLASYSISHGRNQLWIAQDLVRICLPIYNVLGFALVNHCAIWGQAVACHKHYVHLASISTLISNEMWSVFHKSIDIVSFDSCCTAEIRSTPLLTKTISGVQICSQLPYWPKRSQGFLHNFGCDMTEQQLCWSNSSCYFSNEMSIHPITRYHICISCIPNCMILLSW